MSDSTVFRLSFRSYSVLSPSPSPHHCRLCFFIRIDSRVHATKTVSNKFFFSISLSICLSWIGSWHHFHQQYELPKVCAYLWCCCWIRCRCWATFCCCAFSCSSSLASSACNCGKEFYVNAVHSSCQCMLCRPSKFHLFNNSPPFIFRFIFFRSFIFILQLFMFKHYYWCYWFDRNKFIWTGNKYISIHFASTAKSIETNQQIAFAYVAEIAMYRVHSLLFFFIFVFATLWLRFVDRISIYIHFHAHSDCDKYRNRLRRVAQFFPLFLFFSLSTDLREW